MSEVVKFIDVSHWRAHVPWQAFHDNGWEAAYIKNDAALERHMTGAKAAGFTRLAPYLWHDPSLSVEYNVSKAIECIEKIDPTFVVVDIEHWWASWSEWWMAQRGEIGWSSVRALSGRVISDHARDFVKDLDSRTDKKIWIYSAAWFVNSRSPQLMEWIGDYPFINADYSSVPNKNWTLSWDEIDAVAKSVGRSNYLPKGMTAETARQFASKIYPAGVGDHYDMNVYFGSLEEFDQEIGLKEVVVKDPQDPPEVPEYYNAKCTAWYLWVRLGPNQSYKSNGYLVRNETVKVYQEQGEWARIGVNRWVHMDWLEALDKLQDHMYEARCIAWKLYIRKGPNQSYDNYGKIDCLKLGNVAKVYEERFGWAKIGKDRWVSGKWIVKL